MSRPSIDGFPLHPEWRPPVPLFEFLCQDSACRLSGTAVEHFFHSDPGDVLCESCGGKTSRLISTFGIVFTGPLTKKYNNPKLENYHSEGYWAVRKKTLDGKESHVWIDNWDTRREFMKSEGLMDTGPVEIGSDGKSISTRGLPGAWI
jgi:predicted nucleic acid-binding Zn ribbon protein